MKKTTLLHAQLSHLIARLGHGDLLVLGDAGLPIPAGTERIDLAVSANLPRMLAVLDAVLAEMQVEAAVVAEELQGRNPEVAEGLRVRLGATPVTRVPHEELKAMCAGARAVVRTGEFSPYANVVLRSGVVF